MSNNGVGPGAREAALEVILAFKSPTCPRCGMFGPILGGGNVVPIAFCQNEDCDVLTWWPEVSAYDQMIGDICDEIRAGVWPDEPRGPRPQKSGYPESAFSPGTGAPD